MDNDKDIDNLFINTEMIIPATKKNNYTLFINDNNRLGYVYNDKLYTYKIKEDKPNDNNITEETLIDNKVVKYSTYIISDLIYKYSKFKFIEDVEKNIIINIENELLDYSDFCVELLLFLEDIKKNKYTFNFCFNIEKILIEDKKKFIKYISELSKIKHKFFNINDNFFYVNIK